MSKLRSKKIRAFFAAAFGLWKNRDVSIEQIRAKAWSRS